MLALRLDASTPVGDAHPGGISNMTLIRHHIEMLRLREDAPFPSQIEDAQQMIREWRHERRVACRDITALCSRVPDDSDYLSLVGEEE